MNIEKFCEENPVRFRMLGEACKRLAIAGKPITKATLADVLPKDFGVDDNDPFRQIAAEAQRSVSDGTMTATEAPDTAASVCLQADSRETLAARLLDMQRRAADLRGEITTLTTARANARARFADALQIWLHGRPRVTPEQNARAYIAASVQDRAERHVPNHPVFGPSVLDRTCGYGAGGSAEDHLRRQFSSGHRKGAYPASMKNATLPRHDS